MEIIGAKIMTGSDVLCRKVTRPKISLGVTTGEETVYTDVTIFDTTRNQQGQAVAIMHPFSAINPKMELTQAQWDKIVLLELPVSKHLESLYMQATSGIQLS